MKLAPEIPLLIFKNCPWVQAFKRAHWWGSLGIKRPHRGLKGLIRVSLEMKSEHRLVQKWKNLLQALIRAHWTSKVVIAGLTWNLAVVERNRKTSFSFTPDRANITWRVWTVYVFFLNQRIVVEILTLTGSRYSISITFSLEPSYRSMVSETDRRLYIFRTSRSHVHQLTQ